MASISINVFDPQPGKNAEALHLLKEAQEVISAFGARVQVAQLVRGGTPGQNSLIVENDDPESHGALLDKLYADQGFQQFMSRVQAAAVATPIPIMFRAPETIPSSMSDSPSPRSSAVLSPVLRRNALSAFWVSSTKSMNTLA